MVQVRGITFRIERLAACVYEVVRIKDDLRIGTFRTMPELAIVHSQGEPELIREIARAAVQRGKTSWVRRFTPS
jgi:hypothetical protein